MDRFTSFFVVVNFLCYVEVDVFGTRGGLVLEGEWVSVFMRGVICELTIGNHCCVCFYFSQVW